MTNQRVIAKLSQSEAFQEVEVTDLMATKNGDNPSMMHVTFLSPYSFML